MLVSRDCTAAVDRYNAALSEISYTIRRYVACLRGSSGFDDCGTQFLWLRNAQSSFESATMGYRIDCR